MEISQEEFNKRSIEYYNKAGLHFAILLVLSGLVLMLW